MLATATDPIAHLIDLGVAGIVLVMVLYTKVLVPGWTYTQSREDAERRVADLETNHQAALAAAERRLADEQTVTARLLGERNDALAVITRTRDTMDEKILPAFFASSAALEKSGETMRRMVERTEVLDRMDKTLLELQGYVRGRADGTRP